MTDKLMIGNLGEDAAVSYLFDKGYIINERNFKVPVGEIDIIATAPDGCVVFVEVKTRKNADYGYASEFVDKKKQTKLKLAVGYYTKKDLYMRFDIIEVYYKMDKDKFCVTEISHIENAF